MSPLRYQSETPFHVFEMGSTCIGAAKDVEALSLYSVLEGHWASPVLVWQQERRRNAPLTLLRFRSEVSTPFGHSSA